MADSGPPGLSPLQGWQRENILSATAYLRERFGNPPSDPRARIVHDGLLEVLDPARRAVRLQRELGDAARLAALTANIDRRRCDRRRGVRRRVNLGPPEGVSERRKADRRSGTDRRAGM